MIRRAHDNGVITLEFETLVNLPVHGHVATRHGGVSPAPWNSLNFSVTRGDSPARVAENRRRLARALNIDDATIVRCRQVHGADARRVGVADAGSLQPAADALITGAPGLPLALVFADCAPILLYDARKHVLGVCHAGWRGTVARAAAATLAAMEAEFGTQPEDVHAGIGPSIGPASYEVGPEVEEAARAQLPFAAQCFIYPNGLSNRSPHGEAGGGSRNPHFDLWAANRLQLEYAGVPTHQIEVAGIDTAQNTQDFFSHRGEQGRCGLFCMVAWLA